MPTFITESWLRENFSLTPGTEVHLPASGRLTPAGRAMLDERKIRVKYVDEVGRTFRESGESDASGAQESERVQVHPLTGAEHGEPAACQLCGQPVKHKPDALTHLDSQTLVPKNDPRIRLRGKLDSAIAYAVWAQAELDARERESILASWLADVRSGLGNVLRAEVTGEYLSPVRMGELDEEAIHRLSHDPLHYFGHDHIVPESSQGSTIARLNLLRVQIREAEVAAADVYIDREFNVLRPDLMQALNRLGSAVYVLMMLSHVAAIGRPVDVQKLATWT
jgi:ethanolamine utilization cobalamin adenosyltransferase